MAITPQQARAELARRELARRGKLPSSDMGSVDGKPASVRKMGSRFDAFKMGGIPGVVMTEDRPEDLLPAAGQALGGGFAPSVGFASAGEAARQGVRAVRGEGFDPMAIGKTAAATAAGEGIFKGLGKMAPKLSGRLMNSVLRPAKNLVSKGKNLGLEAAEAGYVGSKKGMLRQASGNIGKFEDELQNILKGSTKEADVSTVFKKLDDLKKNYFGNQAAINAIEDMKTSISQEFQFGQYGKMGLPRANEIKRSLYHQIKPSQYGTAEVPHLADIRKTAARAFKEGIEQVEPSVGPINKKLGTAGSVRDALESQLAGEQRKVILPKLAAGGAGLSMMMGNPALAGQIILADLAVEAARSGPVLSGLAGAFLKGSKNKALGRGAALGSSEILRRANRQ